MQVEALRKFCDARSWLITQEFLDHGYSGANTRRPALDELLKLVRSRKIDVVLVYKLDRLAGLQETNFTVTSLQPHNQLPACVS